MSEGPEHLQMIVREVWVDLPGDRRARCLQVIGFYHQGRRRFCPPSEGRGIVVSADFIHREYRRIRYENELDRDGMVMTEALESALQTQAHLAAFAKVYDRMYPPDGAPAPFARPYPFIPTP